MTESTDLSPTNPEISPADEYERRRAVVCERVQSWISRLTRWWLFGQIATLALLGYSVVGAVEGVGWPILITIVAWTLSIVSAGVAAFLTAWNWWILPRGWKFVGLSPASIQMLEATMLVSTLA